MVVLFFALILCVHLTSIVKSISSRLPVIKVHKSKGTVRLRKDISAVITDRHVIIVEDIIDSGLTIKFIRDRMHEAGPKSVAIVTLLLKPDIAKLDFDIDWVGFEISPEFVVGYGLDYDQKLRNLRGVYRLEGIESE